MKKLFFVWALLMANLFCYAATNSSISDKEKEKIKVEVKEVINTLIAGCEQLNLDIVCGTYYDSPDFRYIYNGKIFEYKDIVNAMQPLFDTMAGQKFTFFNEHYNILDRSTVLYTANCKLIAYFKDGHIAVDDPGAAQFILKKIGREWKIIYTVESTVEKKIEKQQAEQTQSSQKSLNQIEQLKKFIGTWKAEVGKDTTYWFEFSSYGENAFVGSYKIKAQDKIIFENKQMWGYDKRFGKIIDVELENKSGTMTYYLCGFISENVLEGAEISVITHPDIVSDKIYYEELKSPDMFIESFMENNQKISIIFNRIK